MPAVRFRESADFSRIFFFLLQNDLNLETSEIISTYVYKTGLTGKPRYSFSAMVGLFNSVINLILLTSVNAIAKRVGETSLW